MTSLIIGHYLVRLHPPYLKCHAVRHVLVVKVLAVTDKVTKEQFRTGIHHLVHIGGSCHPSFLPFVVRTVVEVYLRTMEYHNEFGMDGRTVSKVGIYLFLNSLRHLLRHTTTPSPPDRSDMCASW